MPAASPLDVPDRVEELGGEDVSSNIETTSVDPLAWGAEYLLREYTRRSGVFASTPDTSRHTAIRRTQAPACISFQYQVDAVTTVCKAVKEFASGGLWRPIMFLEHCLYDEDTSQGSDQLW